MRSTFVLVAISTTAVGAAFLGACGGTVAGLDSPYMAPGAGESQTAAGGNGGSVVTGLPCDVQALLASRCDSCHGVVPSGGAPMSIVTYADLSAPALSDPSKTIADVAITRMQSTKLPMPPKPQAPATAAEVAVLQAWVDGGKPHGTCGGGAGGSVGSGAGAGGAGGAVVVDGLPCDVATFVSTNCVTCHGSLPSGGAPMSLVSLADFAAPSKSDPSKSMAQVSATRVVDPKLPMPPSGGLAASDIQMFQAWVANGIPGGSCGAGGAGGGPTSMPLPCPPGQQGTTNTDSGSSMNPGTPCMSCHGQAGNEAPKFAFAGTVYAKGMSYEGICNGASGPASGGLSVHVTDANQKVFTASVDGVGNFYLRTKNATGFTTPYTLAEIVVGGATVVNHMATAQTSGDCNSCHTAAGVNGAPGRIFGP